MTNKFRIGKGFFGETLKEKDRYKHISLGSISKEHTRRFWLKILEMEGSQPCSSIIVTRDSSLVTEVEKVPQNGKKLHYIDPDREGSLSLNPLFHSDATTVKWLTEFFVGDGEDLLQTVFSLLANIAITDTKSEKSLLFVWGLAELGRNKLIQFLEFQTSPICTVARIKMEQFKKDDLETALHQIYCRLSFLKSDRAQAMISEQKFYAPILFHEPSTVIIYSPPDLEFQDLVLKLLIHSIIHQVISARKKHDSGSIYLHLDGMDLVPFSALSELEPCRLGLLNLSDTVKALPETRCHFHINIKSAEKGILSTLKKVKTFRPVMSSR